MDWIILKLATKKIVKIGHLINIQIKLKLYFITSTSDSQKGYKTLISILDDLLVGKLNCENENNINE